MTYKRSGDVGFYAIYMIRLPNRCKVGKYFGRTGLATDI